MINPAAVGWSNSQAVAEFSKGKTGYLLLDLIIGRHHTGREPCQGQVRFALLPTVPPGVSSRPSNGVEAASILSGDNLVVADYSDNKDLAFEFVKMITEKEAQLDYYEKFGNLPVNAEAAATLESDPKLKRGSGSGGQVGGDTVQRRLG